MTWEKLPALGTMPMPLDWDICTGGSGYAGLLKDGAEVYREPRSSSEGYWMDGWEAERMASADPDHDWRIIIGSPIIDQVYQRHDDNHWALIAADKDIAKEMAP